MARQHQLEFDRLLGQARMYLLIGALVSLAGFVWPWFKFSESAQWWYNGWQLAYDGEVLWIFLIFIGYAAILVAGYFFLERGAAVLTVVLVIAVTAGGLMAVSLAAADALEEVRALYQLKWNIGLLIMAAGHGGMGWGAFAAWTLVTLRDIQAA